jgi:hypothetical protein
VCISSTGNVPFETVDGGGYKLLSEELWFFVVDSMGPKLFVVELIVWFDIDIVDVLVVSGTVAFCGSMQ